jgi:hypothetical protein
VPKYKRSHSITCKRLTSSPCEKSLSEHQQLLPRIYTHLRPLHTQTPSAYLPIHPTHTMEDTNAPTTPGSSANFTDNETKLICAIMQNLTSEIQVSEAMPSSRKKKTSPDHSSPNSTQTASQKVKPLTPTPPVRPRKSRPRPRLQKQRLPARPLELSQAHQACCRSCASRRSRQEHSEQESEEHSEESHQSRRGRRWRGGHSCQEGRQEDPCEVKEGCYQGCGGGGEE